MKIRIVRLALIISGALFVAIHYARHVYAAPTMDLPPNLTLSVAARVKEKGQLGQTIWRFTLSCLSGGCQLEDLMLNACDKKVISGEATANPDVVTYSTRDGNLKVLRAGNVISAEVTDYGQHFMTLRFGFTKESLGYMRAATFTGTMVRGVDVLPPGAPLTVELLPLEGQFVRVPLDCALRLPGIFDGK